jgi:polyhydroxybutyrate depolymerase
MMKRFLILATAFVVTLGVAVFAGANILNAIERPTSTVTDSMEVGNLTRSWVVVSPTATLPESAPIIVVLSGLAASTSQEINRDNMLPYAKADKAELVYPVSIRESWNVGGCCGASGSLKIDDVGFLEQLVPRVDPGHKRPIYIIGYSNGGRMAYDLECTDPGLFDGMAIMKADPMPGCEVSAPQNVLVVSALDDPWVPFKTGEKGKETPAASVQIARLNQSLGCSSKSAVATHGDMTITAWSSCNDGKRLSWAVYSTGGHNWPPPRANTPSGSAIIWSFFTKTTLAPLPRA